MTYINLATIVFEGTALKNGNNLTLINFFLSNMSHVWLFRRDRILIRFLEFDFH